MIEEHDDPHDCIEDPARLPRLLKCETGAVIGIACDILATPNSLKSLAR
jgi:hypothetical protein